MLNEPGRGTYCMCFLTSMAVAQILNKHGRGTKIKEAWSGAQKLNKHGDSTNKKQTFLIC